MATLSDQPEDYGSPRRGDVVTLDDGANYTVREIDAGTLFWVKVSAGRTDPGTWVLSSRCTVVYRASEREKDDV